MSKFNVGDKVRYIGKEHKELPEFYPEFGTIGIIINSSENSFDVYVQWEKGSTSKEDCWYCDKNDIELIIENMTNEEIWEMLKPKLVKNGLDWIHYGYDVDGNKFYYFDEIALKNAVAIAYKSGYYRSQKGRPFKFGEKKKKDRYWEPVDPNNLPKEGTKVRYSRECKDYKKCESKIVIGDTGVVKFAGPNHDWFGIKLDKRRSQYYNWFSFDGNSANCLDMWMEDDE